MRRSNKTRTIGLKAWLLGLLFVGGGLFALFSLKPADLLPKDWPLGIRPSEVEHYAELFDRRPVEMGNGTIIEYKLSASKSMGGCIEEHAAPGWVKRLFMAPGYTDSVEVRQLRDRAGMEVKFPEKNRFNGQRRLYLLPSDVSDIQDAYLELLAKELGLITPTVAYVHVSGCTGSGRAYRTEERIDADLLERRGLTNALRVLLSLDPTHPDGQFAKVGGNEEERAQVRGIIERAVTDARSGDLEPLLKLMDHEAAASWLIMAGLDGRELREEKVMFAYQWTTGKLQPIYCSPRNEWQYYAEDHAPLSPNLLTPLLADPDFRALFEKKRTALQQKIPELRGRFATLDLTWLPVLADVAALPFAKTTAMQAQYKLLDRRLTQENAAEHLHRKTYFAPGHATFLHGMSVPEAAAPVADNSEVLAALAKRYKLRQNGDTLVFPRGKYMIDEDLLIPQGIAVVLLEGVRLFLAKDVSLVVRGAFHVRGTLRNPVFVRSMERDAFGTVAMLGDGSQRCRINGLLISGGAGATVGGVRYAGMVSIHGSASSTVINSAISMEEGETALHIDGGQVKLEGIRFEGGSKAQLIIDRANGSVSDCSFLERNAERIANGVSVNACKLAFDNVRVTGMLGTGISVEAASQVLVRKSRFERNAVAISAADLSKVHVEGNNFLGNTLVFRASHDRNQRGGILLVYSNEFIDNTKERDADESSEITNVAIFDQKVLGLFGIAVDPPPSVRRVRR
ncbi:MAG: hypothetical protein IPO87_15560 [Flavobacteriales bacterium]|nr:hypothetical protein [Flavobacteriales bacterium]